MHGNNPSDVPSANSEQILDTSEGGAVSLSILATPNTATPDNKISSKGEIYRWTFIAH